MVSAFIQLKLKISKNQQVFVDLLTKNIYNHVTFKIILNPLIFILMKNFYFLIVFILGAIFGIGCVVLVQKYVLQNEAEMVAKEVVLKEQPQTSSANTVKSIQPVKDDEVSKTPVIDKPDEPKTEEKGHTFFAMFASLTVLCLIIAVAYGVNANHSDQTKLASIFFGIAALACAVVAFFCY